MVSVVCRSYHDMGWWDADHPETEHGAAGARPPADFMDSRSLDAVRSDHQGHDHRGAEISRGRWPPGRCAAPRGSTCRRPAHRPERAEPVGPPRVGEGLRRGSGRFGLRAGEVFPPSAWPRSRSTDVPADPQLTGMKGPDIRRRAHRRARALRAPNRIPSRGGPREFAFPGGPIHGLRPEDSRPGDRSRAEGQGGGGRDPWHLADDPVTTQSRRHGDEIPRRVVATDRPRLHVDGELVGAVRIKDGISGGPQPVPRRHGGPSARVEGGESETGRNRPSTPVSRARRRRRAAEVKGTTTTHPQAGPTAMT